MLFSFFSTKKRLVNTGVFNGATDWHSHILPGVDDGIQTMEDSLAVLDCYEKIGIKEVWLTPHIMEDIPNTIEELRDRFQELQEAYQGTVKLNLAAENMMDNLFSERLESKELLPIGSKGDHLLVETSYYQPPIDLYGTLKRVKELGLMSLAGVYGDSAQEKAQMLLSKGYYTFFGSDLHHLPTFQKAINAKALKKDTVDMLPRIQNLIF